MTAGKPQPRAWIVIVPATLTRSIGELVPNVFVEPATVWGLQLGGRDNGRETIAAPIPCRSPDALGVRMGSANQHAVDRRWDFVASQTSDGRCAHPHGAVHAAPMDVPLADIGGGACLDEKVLNSATHLGEVRCIDVRHRRAVVPRRCKRGRLRRIRHG